MTEITEANITKDWKNSELPLVSIIYMTYNHEQYVTEAMEGFLHQKTDFPFEIIIHDDASTDRTAEIIESYAKKYPNIIKTIFQKENKFSQPRTNVLLIAVSYARGEYFAFCEGDDYWIDPKKLQIQINEMKKNSDCDISFHSALNRSVKKSQPGEIISKQSSYNKVFSPNKIILGGAGFCPTASLIIKNTIFQSIPHWFLDAPVGDYFLQILASLKGGALYINRAMSVYRIGSAGSWSVRIESDENYTYDYFIRHLKSIEDINLYTHKKYSKEFNIIIRKICFFMCINPVLSLQKRRNIFLNQKHLFNFKKKIIWYLLFNNTRVCRLIYSSRNYTRLLFLFKNIDFSNFVRNKLRLLIRRVNYAMDKKRDYF